MTTEKRLLEHLVQDHKIQAGIALAVSMNVWHWRGDTRCHAEKIWRVEEIIEVLKTKHQILISDPDGTLCCEGRIYVGVIGGRPSESLRFVSRVAYIGAVVILAANAIDIQRQLRESAPPDKMPPPPESLRSPF